MIFKDLLMSPLFYLVDPTKRIFFIYILSSLFLALIVLLLQNNSFDKSIKKIFDLRIWNHPSSRIDISLWFFNIFLKSFVFVGITYSAIKVAKSFVHILYSGFPHFQPIDLSFEAVVGLYSVSSFVMLDFSRFYQHYLSHKWPFFWRFHKVHHTAEVLTPMTLYRTHPIESLLSSIVRVLFLGCLSGLFIFLFRTKIDAYVILGVNALDFIFNFLGSNLRHSHVWLSFGPLNHIIISPAQHQIHHSRSKKHRHKNLGFTFSIWDKMFGSFYQVSSKKEFVIFGVRDERTKNFVNALLLPFKNKRKRPLTNH
jgi:sterol desaturase/sphingolipid hydroxylase (fatty acid hydroxylase superfamily)